MKILLLSVSTAALVAASTAGAVGQKQRPLKFRHSCATKAERSHVVRFRASDRVRLIGVELGRGPRGVVLAHQGASDLCIWLPYGRALAARGYRVLVFDHRGFGSSGSPGRSIRRNRVDYDVLGAIRTLRARGATSVVLAGGSLGGAAVVSAGARATPPVNGVISLSAPASFGRLDLVKAARALQVPVLFVAEEEDQPFSDDARTMYEACPSADKQLAVLPGVDHGIFMLREPSIRALVDDFLARHS